MPRIVSPGAGVPNGTARVADSSPRFAREFAVLQRRETVPAIAHAPVRAPTRIAVGEVMLAAALKGDFDPQPEPALRERHRMVGQQLAIEPGRPVARALRRQAAGVAWT